MSGKRVVCCAANEGRNLRRFELNFRGWAREQHRGACGVRFPEVVDVFEADAPADGAPSGLPGVLLIVPYGHWFRASSTLREVRHPMSHFS